MAFIRVEILIEVAETPVGKDEREDIVRSIINGEKQGILHPDHPLPNKWSIAEWGRTKPLRAPWLGRAERLYLT